MELKNIYAAFVKAQTGFAPALKTSLNPHFKSKYADLAACVEAVIDSLNANGIGLVQRTMPDERGVTVETVFIHESGESFSGGALHVPAAKQDPQGYGSALSYARRYSLMAACGIAPEDDDGNSASKPRPAARPATAVITPTAGALESLPAEEQGYMRELANDLIAIFRRHGQVPTFDRVQADELDNDQSVALWSLLPSDIRSALKREGKARADAAASAGTP